MTGEEDLLCITGSLYMVGEAKAFLGVPKKLMRTFNPSCAVFCGDPVWVALLFLAASGATLDTQQMTRGGGPVEIEADELSFEKEEQRYEGHGQVEITRGDLSLKADHARLSMATKDVMAWGNVVLREGEDVLECERLEVNLDTRSGKGPQGQALCEGSECPHHGTRSRETG